MRLEVFYFILFYFLFLFYFLIPFTQPSPSPSFAPTIPYTFVKTELGFDQDEEDFFDFMEEYKIVLSKTSIDEIDCKLTQAKLN